MSDRKFFGTDGIRGEANRYPITSDIALKLGKAVGVAFQNGRSHHKIVIGKDTRLSGYMLETALASGIVSTGCDVMLVGPLPTPGIAFITNGMRGDAGIVISASHNPYTDNGIKLFDRFGYKLEDDLEKRIESLIRDEGHADHISAAAEAIGRAFRIDDAVGRYIVFLKSTFPAERTLADLKLVVDCAHGACYKVSPSVFYELGAEVIETGVEPDGTNINKDVGALHPSHVAELVRTHGADAGIAVDGDGDRLVMVDEKGTVLDGDALLAICGVDMLRKGTLTKNTMVATVMSNRGLDRMMKSHGGTVLRSNVGDRYVISILREQALNFGGESSGHIIFRDHGTTGDGTLAALQVLDLMVRTDRPLSQLAAEYQPVPQSESSIYVCDKPALTAVTGYSQLLNDAESALGSEGQVLIRYSGTENKIRIMVQGANEVVVSSFCDRFTDLFFNTLGEKA